MARPRTTPQPLNPHRAVAVIRASTERQCLGLDAQQAALHRWCTTHQVTLAHTYREEDFSGSLGLADRPILLEAIAALRPNDAGVLLFAERSRIARDALNAGLIEREVRMHGATIRTADGHSDGEDPAAKLQRTILDAIAEHERGMIRARIKAALAVKKARGEKTGSAPWGMTTKADGKTLTPNPSEVAMTQLAKSMRAEGASYAKIRDHLNAQGARNRKGKPLHLTQVVRMIQS